MGMGMAVTATTAYISGLDFPTPKRITLKKCKFSNSIGFARVGGIRNSSDVSAEAESESPVEVSNGPPSLISALNVEKALRGIAITDADHYGRLGIQKGCSYDEVTVAYKKKMEELMNEGEGEGEGEGLDEEELGKRLELLKESHSILSCVEERRLYDWSLARSEKQDNRYVWPFEVDITKTTPDSPPPQEPEDVGPTRLVGYFMFVWLILAFTLSIALNRHTMKNAMLPFTWETSKAHYIPVNEEYTMYVNTQ